ncbi:Uncharacterised protein [Vibrio cholerae]|uniref:Uncharacterized protein n=1 Tax=Vibrio cholerae TaxID=666 RepID=A0A655V6E8_VIBCL|nr:Uncharacterised protein [Vibrio cholerae]CSA13276.1 Uncharacterised protein [Vibrio cholerae]CSB62282.1 Uncharacterised protein [Vibrio cholerae]CSD05742.1 Uncharacterised protein [Vibrio cholerae]CSD21540.1 Uncharacterised protein [Vibrio cholerae]
MRIPISAEIAVVTSKIPIVRLEILPSEPFLSRRTTAEIIDTSTSGMMTIFSRPT